MINNLRFLDDEVIMNNIRNSLARKASSDCLVSTAPVFRDELSCRSQSPSQHSLSHLLHEDRSTSPDSSYGFYKDGDDLSEVFGFPKPVKLNTSRSFSRLEDALSETAHGTFQDTRVHEPKLVIKSSRSLSNLEDALSCTLHGGYDHRNCSSYCCIHREARSALSTVPPRSGK
jgi:hypothetical protein